MERAVTFIPILFRIPHLNLPFRRAAPPTNSCPWKSPASHFPGSLTWTYCSLSPHLEIPSLALCLSTVIGPCLASPPHSPSGMLQGAISGTCPHGSSSVPSCQSPALDNMNHWFFLTAAAPRLPSIVKQRVPFFSERLAYALTYYGES